MAQYNPELKESIVRQLLSPGSKSLAAIHRETGVSEPTLRSWRAKALRGKEAASGENGDAERWSGEDKLAAVIETASLNEQELGEYCRRKGLYAEQIERWRGVAMAATERLDRLTPAERKKWHQAKKRVHELEKELARKDAALAETAALLVLKKKAQTLWGEREDV